MEATPVSGKARKKYIFRLAKASQTSKTYAWQTKGCQFDSGNHADLHDQAIAQSNGFALLETLP